jgi:ketosteroid isomerase-like protein
VAGLRIDDDLVRGWIQDYLTAWRTRDRAKIEALFTPDATYRPHPDGPLASGRTAIADAWLDEADDAGNWTSELTPMLVHDDTAIITGWTDYADEERFLNLWIVRFGADGACADFTEWWMTRRSGR